MERDRAYVANRCQHTRRGITACHIQCLFTARSAPACRADPRANTCQNHSVYGGL
jgi:hypothetical protein